VYRDLLAEERSSIERGVIGVSEIVGGQYNIAYFIDQTQTST